MSVPGLTAASAPMTALRVELRMICSARCSRYHPPLPRAFLPPAETPRDHAARRVSLSAFKQSIDRDHEHTDVRRSLSPDCRLAAVRLRLDDVDLTAGTDGDDLVPIEFAAEIAQVIQQPFHQHRLFFAAVAVGFVHDQDQRFAKCEQPLNGLAFVSREVAVADEQDDLRTLRLLDGDLIELAFECRPCPGTSVSKICVPLSSRQR